MSKLTWGTCKSFNGLPEPCRSHTESFEALYEALGALTRLITGIAARAIDYPDGAAGIALVERLWAETVR